MLAIATYCFKIEEYKIVQIIVGNDTEIKLVKPKTFKKIYHMLACLKVV